MHILIDAEAAIDRSHLIVCLSDYRAYPTEVSFLYPVEANAFRSTLKFGEHPVPMSLKTTDAIV